MAKKRTVIDAKGISKIYQMGEVEVKALRGVDVEIKKVKLFPSWVLPDPVNQH